MSMNGLEQQSKLSKETPASQYYLGKLANVKDISYSLLNFIDSFENCRLAVL